MLSSPFEEWLSRYNTEQPHGRSIASHQEVHHGNIPTTSTLDWSEDPQDSFCAGAIPARAPRWNLTARRRPFARPYFGFHTNDVGRMASHGNSTSTLPICRPAMTISCASTTRSSGNRADRSFDAVVASSVLEYVGDLELVFRRTGAGTARRRCVDLQRAESQKSPART